MLKHDSLDAWVYFSVAPYPDAYPDPDGKGREKLVGIAKRARVSAGALFEESLSFNFKKGWLFETPVWEAQYTFGRGERKTVLEYRFGRGGMEYTIRAGCPATNFKAWLPTLKAACEAFSFLPAVDVSEDRYLDARTGYAIIRPSAKWTFDVNVFDSETPLKMWTKNGAGRITVSVISNGKSPQDLVEGYYSTLKKGVGGECTELFKEDGERNGAQIVNRRVRGYAAKEKTATEFSYFLCQRPSGVLQVQGIAPASGDAAAAIKADVEKVMAALRILDTKAASARLAKTNSAVESFADGVKLWNSRRFDDARSSFNKALAVFPTFVRAIYLRGLCSQALKEWQSFRDDMEKVNELDPTNPEPGKRVAQSYRAEALQAYRDKNLVKAQSLIKRALRNDRKNEGLQKDLIDIFKASFRDAQRSGEKALKASIKEIAGASGLMRGSKKWSAFVVESYLGAANTYLRAKNFRKAKDMARKAQRLDRGNKRIKRMLESIKSQADREQGRK